MSKEGLLAISLGIFSLAANPVGERVVVGEAAFARGEDSLVVTQTTDRAIVEWDTFSIEQWESTEFIQPTESAAILNRVKGDLPSRLEGNLMANGSVYLINPKGVVIGGKVRTRQFVASTFDVSNESFSLKQEAFEEGEPDGEILHSGEITASDVALIARRIRNEGVIRAKGGTVKMIVSPTLGKVYQIEGEIDLATGSKIDVSGSSGGEVEISLPERLFVQEGAEILADGFEEEGGRVILFANGTTEFHGNISARGEKKGGFVEISANKNLLVTTHPDVRSANGKAGLVLFDPGTVTINHSASSGGASNNTFGDSYINTQLGLGSLTISTANSTDAGNETLTFDNALGDVVISWSDATTFTAVGRRNMVIESGTSITSTNAGTNFDAIVLQGNTTSAVGGFSGITTSSSSTFSSVSGNITITGVAGTTAAGAHGLIIGNGTTISSTGSGAITLSGTGGGGSASHGIQGVSGCSITSSGSGAIRLTGEGGTLGTSHGITCSGSISSSSSGSITLEGTANGTTTPIGVVLSGGSVTASDTGTITMTGTGSTAATTSVGIDITSTSTVSTTSGTLTLTGTGGGSGAGGSSHGVGIRSSSTVSTTTGALDVTGNAGQGTGSSTIAVFLNATGSLSTTDGAITILGQPAGATTKSVGVRLQNGSSVTASGTGTISVTGTGKGSDTVNHGVDVGGSAAGTVTLSTNSGTVTVTGTGTGSSGRGVFLSSTTEGVIKSTSGSVTVTGTGGTGAVANNAGIHVSSLNTIGVVGGTGSITMKADVMRLDGTITGAGALTIQPLTDSTSIGLGTSSTGTLNLTSTELATIADGFSSTTFGSATGTGDIEMTAYTYLDPLIVQGGTITVSDAIGAGANDVTLKIGVASAGTLNLNDLVTTTGTTSFQGGSLSDTFNINVGAQTATLNGGGGTNTLVGPDLSNTWAITGQNSGTLYSTLAFSNVQNLTGGSLGDVFVFSDGKGVSGLVDGGGSIPDNILDYSLFTTSPDVVFVTSTSGTANNLGNGFQNIGSAILPDSAEDSTLATAKGLISDLIIMELKVPSYYDITDQIWSANYNTILGPLNEMID